MPILQINRVKDTVPLAYHPRIGLISKEAEYECIEIIIGPLQLELGFRTRISEYDHDRRPAAR